MILVSVGVLDEYTFLSVIAPHTISATFIKIVEIYDVTIPNVTMGIGDIISATITVSNDGGIPYSFISGSIGGYPLTGFTRVDATTYGANFEITEGGNSYLANQNIPVSNLGITNGTITSITYNLPIVQNNDLLDASIPAVISMAVESGTKKIGDVVVLNITADGLGYSILTTSTINGISITESNVIFNELSGGNYQLTYTVKKGTMMLVLRAWWLY